MTLASLALATAARAQAPDPHHTLVIELKAGKVLIGLRPDLAPKHVERVKLLARQGFYDGLKFHRVIDGFMAQTGDPKGDGTGGSSLPDLPAEFTRTVYRRGSVGAARTTDPNSANSQFFICFGDGCKGLTGLYTLWGEVIQGMAHIDRLARGQPPGNPDIMLKVYLLSDPSGAVAAKTPSPPAVRPAPPRPTSPAASAERRVALVIGNSQYRDVERLRNAGNDARAIAASFRRLGFAEVEERYEVDLAALGAALKSFSDRVVSADWAVIYYAGHGIEMGGSTYIIPVDAKLLRDTHLAFEALPLERMLASVEYARKLRLVILDACRNNPFLPKMDRTASVGRSIGRGLGRIEPDGGVLVAYAAKHGSTAEDGAEAHSPYAEALLAYLEEPGIEIKKLFGKVRDRVFERTNRSQEPFVYGSWTGEDYYFRSAAQ